MPHPGDADRLARVLRVCEEALAREGEERAAHIDAACGADAALRCDVEALLARRDDSRDGFLVTPPWQRPERLLAAGQRLGPYEVTGALGAGGMGAVYRARDLRLDRTVAIKVIAGTEMDGAARERLAREARAIAAINHPNICAIYDVGREVPSNGAEPAPDARHANAAAGLGPSRAPRDSSDPLDFLVIEYVEGQTLADRIASGPLGLIEALQVAIHVADALAAAHRKGIVHGDLKPANIMLSHWPAGPVAKLLDFGLAEIVAASGTSDEQLRPVPEGRVRHARAVRGTLPYMAPEQLEGDLTDVRTDVFAFGCVLYEMVAGRRAFAGDNEASVMSAIMTTEPPVPSAVQPGIPGALDRLITRCLAKNPTDRWESALGIANELRSIAEPRAVSNPLVAPPSPRVWRLLGGVAALIILGGLVARGAWRSPPPATVAPRTLVLPAPEGVTLGGSQGLEFSADGSAVIYLGINNSTPALYWQNLNETDARLIPGTQAPGQRFLPPFLSPDGAWLGFIRGDELTKVQIRGGQVVEGSAVTLAHGIGWIRGVSWGDGGTILYCPNPFGGLWRASAEGGPPRELTRPDPSRSELSHCWPHVLPGGHAALFTIKHASGRQDRSAIAVVDLDTGRVTRLIERGSYPRYAASGHIVYALNGSLLAVPFDLASLSVRGRPTRVLNDVSMESAGGLSARFAISSTGTLAYEPAPPRPSLKNSLIAVDHDGQVEAIAADRFAYTSSLSLSPNGEKLAVRIEDAKRGDSQLWTYGLRDHRWQQLTTEGDNSAPLWSPTGDRIAFSSNRSGAFNLYVVRADGRAPPERLSRSPHWQYGSSWSPDGKLLAYQEQGSEVGFNAWMLPLEGDRTPWRWGPENVNVVGVTFSPDGRWVAYQSQESGRVEVYVRPFSRPGPKVRVSGAHGGSAPLWSRDGQSVLYLDGTAIMGARIDLGRRLRVFPPHLVFPLPFVLSGPLSAGRDYAPTPDGQRVIVMRPDQEKTPQPRRVLVIPNWVEELRAKTSTAR